MSACGWPEPSTGIRLPRGQCAALLQLARERVQLADRALEVLLADLVVGGGHRPRVDSAARSARPCACISDLRVAPGARRRSPRWPRRARRRRGLASAGTSAPARRAGDDGLRDDVGVAQRLEELLRAVEVAHADPHRAEALGDVRSPSRRPPTIRYLAAKRAASSLNAPIATRGLKTSIASMSSRIVEQVLVVGHRVHAVERVRHVDEPALAAGSRRSSPASVSPRGIFSSRNRPITSPWSAVLTSSPTITLTPTRRPSRAPRARRRSRCGR